MCQLYFQELFLILCSVIVFKKGIGKKNVLSSKIRDEISKMFSSPVLLSDFVHPNLCPDEKLFQVVPRDECLSGLNPSYIPFVTEGFVSLPGELKMYL